MQNITNTNMTKDQCAEGVAQALLRDHTNATKAVIQKLDTLELRLAALARARGVPESEIQSFLLACPQSALSLIRKNNP